MYFGALPTSYHLYRSPREIASDRTGVLGPLVVRNHGPSVTYDVWDEDAKKEADSPSNELNVWDVRGLVDLALITAHSKLRQGAGWKGRPSSPPPSSPRARMSEPAGPQALAQPPAWEHLDSLQ